MKDLLPQLERACAHGGETGALVGALDWSKTPLGPMASWPRSLQLTVSICLSTKFPMAINWGRELSQIYNDAARQVYGRKHPTAMGRPARTNFPEFWELTALDQVLQHIRETELPFQVEDQWIPLRRWGFQEETFFTFALSPLLDDNGTFCGVLNTFMETTARVLAERRMATLRALAEYPAQSKTIEGLCERAIAALATNPFDLRFVLLYVEDADTGWAALKGANRIKLGTPATLLSVPLLESPPSGSFAWPIARVMRRCEAEFEEDLEAKFDVGAAIQKGSPPRRAVVLPLAQRGEKRAVGALVVGLSPRLFHDDAYMSFLHLVASQLAASIAGTRAYLEARERAEKLADLDRAKNVFYSNISHEFRTPLTLMLLRIEDLLSRRNGSLPHAPREALETVWRNALRLLKLVNGLLDLARIEAGRLEPQLLRTDLATLTRELVTGFELAIRQAGLGLSVECPPLPRPVYVDPEMWERVVSNLLSNALKYTRAGKIAVTLRAVDDRVHLVVRDTGIGIPAEDLPHIFERFYRVGDTKGRPVEGAGIGLALVHELVKLHGGSANAVSIPQKGTSITVQIPFGSARVGTLDNATTPEALRASPREARGWIGERVTGRRATEPAARERAADSLAAAGPEEATAETPRPRILIAEDNSDTRQYLMQLLAPRYEVDAVSDGDAALAAAESRVPDLVLSDVLMPGLDGFALLHALRVDPRTRAVPVLLLSARVGEESVLEGLGGGADDYVRKPFSARELLARVHTHLELAGMRREAAEYEMMDAFLGIISHELRTPVTTLKLVLQSIERQRGGSGTSLAFRLPKLDRAISRIEVLIEDMVSVAAIRWGQLTLRLSSHDLAAICRAAAEEHGLPDGLPIVLELPDEPVEAMVDDVRILQVVTNLLSNARKYSPPNCPVVLSVRRSGDEVHLTVRDQGPGIPPDEVPLIFKRFHRVPSIHVQSGSQTGLGLGLYICRGIVEQHHGRIWVETEEGHGSTFHVVLPLKPPISESIAVAPARKNRDG